MLVLQVTHLRVESQAIHLRVEFRIAQPHQEQAMTETLYQAEELHLEATIVVEHRLQAHLIVLIAVEDHQVRHLLTVADVHHHLHHALPDLHTAVEDRQIHHIVAEDHQDHHLAADHQVVVVDAVVEDADNT